MASAKDVVGAAVVDIERREECDSGVSVLKVLSVVPGEEGPGEGAGVLIGAEATGEFGPILQGFEVTFREGVII